MVPEQRSQKQLAFCYGMAIDDYERMYYGQDGRCAICKEKPDLLCVDHCHGSGLVRGLLCKKCNTGLGYFKDDPELFERAIRYLSDYLLDYRDYCAKCAEKDWRGNSIHLPLQVLPGRGNQLVAFYTCSKCSHEWTCSWRKQFTPCILD